MVPSVNPVLGLEFLKKIQYRYDWKGDEEAYMMFEKLQLLVTSIVEPTKKVI
jgi:hypothetical protein